MLYTRLPAQTISQQNTVCPPITGQDIGAEALRCQHAADKLCYFLGRASTRVNASVDRFRLCYCSVAQTSDGSQRLAALSAFWAVAKGNTSLAVSPGGGW